jgi:formylglycine-generating enzyme required for sulfatase activity
MPGSAEVGTYDLDRTVEGVMDLAGNVQEWTSSLGPDNDPSVRVTRGAQWSLPESELTDLMAIENDRAASYKEFGIGARCSQSKPADQKGSP